MFFIIKIIVKFNINYINIYKKYFFFNIIFKYYGRN
jgi:hypothetical protein